MLSQDLENSKILHIIDFGLAKSYLDPKNNKHITFKKDKSLTGTVRYCSINSHMGRELSRRDDIETLAYIILYLCDG